MEEKITAEDWSAINDIIIKIYTMHPYPDLCTVLQQLKKVIPYSHSVSCLISNTEQGVEFFSYKSKDISQEHIDRYTRRYIYYDFILWYCAVPKELAVRQSDVINEKYMKESLFMQEWLMPINAYYGAVANVAANGLSYGNLCIYRAQDEGDFSDREIQILKTVNHHLCIRYKELFPKGLHRNGFDKNVSHYAKVYHLTEREVELVTLVCEGTRRHDIAKAMFISENTVKKHLNSIYAKMGVQNFEEFIDVIKPGVKYFRE